MNFRVDIWTVNYRDCEVMSNCFKSEINLGPTWLPPFADKLKYKPLSNKQWVLMANSRRMKYLDQELPSDPKARRKALQKLYEKTRIS